MSEALLKTAAPDLHELAEPVIPHLPDLRAAARCNFRDEVWDAWNDLWMEYDNLRCQLATEDRKQWLWLLKRAHPEHQCVLFLKHLGIGIRREKECKHRNSGDFRDFFEFFPIMSYLLVRNGGYHFFLHAAHSGATGLFQLSDKLPKHLKLQVTLQESHLLTATRPGIFDSVRLDPTVQYSYRRLKVPLELLERVEKPQKIDLRALCRLVGALDSVIKDREPDSQNKQTRDEVLLRLIHVALKKRELSVMPILRSLVTKGTTPEEIASCIAVGMDCPKLPQASLHMGEVFVKLLDASVAAQRWDIADKILAKIKKVESLYEDDSLYPFYSAMLPFKVETIYLSHMNKETYDFSKHRVSWNGARLAGWSKHLDGVDYVLSQLPEQQVAGFVTAGKSLFPFGELDIDRLQLMEKYGCDVRALCLSGRAKKWKSVNKCIYFLSKGIKVPVSDLPISDVYAADLSGLYTEKEISKLLQAPRNWEIAVITLHRYLTLAEVPSLVLEAHSLRWVRLCPKIGRLLSELLNIHIQDKLAFAKLILRESAVAELFLLPGLDLNLCWLVRSQTSEHTQNPLIYYIDNALTRRERWRPNLAYLIENCLQEEKSDALEHLSALASEGENAHVYREMLEAFGQLLNEVSNLD